MQSAIIMIDGHGSLPMPRTTGEFMLGERRRRRTSITKQFEQLWIFSGLCLHYGCQMNRPLLSTEKNGIDCKKGPLFISTL